MMSLARTALTVSRPIPLDADERLDDDRAAKHVSEHRAERRQRRTDGVLERMARDDLAPGASLGPRGADVGRAHDVHQRGSELAGSDRRNAGPDGDSGKQDMAQPHPPPLGPRHVSSSGQPALVDGEVDDQQHDQPVAGHGDAHGGEHHTQPVPDGAWPQTADQPDGRADCEAEDEAYQCNGHGPRQRHRDLVLDRSAPGDRLTAVQLDRLGAN